MAEEDDRYVNSFSIKEKLFDDGNSILAIDIQVDDFIKKLQSIPKNKEGFAKLRIVRRKSPSQWGHTHFMAVYTPRIQEAVSDGNNDSKKRKVKKGEKDSIKGGSDDHPF